LPLRRAAHDDFKKATISRAEGGQLQARVGRILRYSSSGYPYVRLRLT
jgi:hypothetical protein